MTSDEASVRCRARLSTLAAPVGSSTLVRHDNGMSAHLGTTALTPGDVVTIRWVIFNDPGGCRAGIPNVSSCGPVDAARYSAHVHWGSSATPRGRTWTQRLRGGASHRAQPWAVVPDQSERQSCKGERSP